jgi:ABC-type transport system involved in multi-copper enzyme maturation permease subunit
MSKGTIANQEHEAATDRWHATRETAPSVIREDNPTFARVVGLAGLISVTLGAAVFVASARSVEIITRWFGPVSGGSLVIIGVVCLLFHALTERDEQVRRIYGIVGFVCIGVGVLITTMKFNDQRWAMFLLYGCIVLALGLLFLLAFLRNEVDATWRAGSICTIGAIGAILAGTGFIWGSISENFLIPYGLLLTLLGLAFLGALIGQAGSSTRFGYWAALAVGAAGLLVVAIALSRSLWPLAYTLRWVQVRPEHYLVPSGLLLMFVGLAYASVAVGLVSDNQLIVLTRREIGAFFYSPIAYIVFFAFVWCAWFCFYQFASILFPTPNPFGPTPLPDEPIVRFYILNWLPLIVGVFLGVPMLTMRLLSEEQRTGTLEVLFTAPVTETLVVISKFIASVIFFIVALLPWAIFLVALRIEGGQPFEFRPLLTFFAALLCSGAGFLSLGVFFSSLTRNQIASAILTAMGLLGLTVVYFIKINLERSQTGSVWITLLERASYIDLWITSLEGKFAPQQMIFFVSFAILWLFITVKLLESRKWR